MRRITRQRKIAIRTGENRVVPTEREIVVHTLKMSGMPRAEIARLLRVSKTTIDFDLMTIKDYIRKSPLYLKIWRRLHYDSLKKVEKVFQKYLDGKGRDPAGDLRLALRLAENIGLLEHRPGIEINNPGGDVNFLDLQQQRVLSLRQALVQFGVKVKEIESKEVKGVGD